MLDAAFQGSLRAAEAERLKTHIYLLLGAAELEAPTNNTNPDSQQHNSTTLWFPDMLTEPRFMQINSGLYGVVQNEHHEILWVSPSLQLHKLSSEALSHTALNTGTEHFEQRTLEQEALFSYYYDVSWENQLFRFSVFHSQMAMQAELSSYRTQLWRWLGALAVLLLSAQTLILQWGLSPLRQLATDLDNMKSGQSNQLQGIYPREIQSVTDNLNQVLKDELAQRERYRTTLADLAHSLKTPLAVMRGSLDTPSSKPFTQETVTDTLQEQITRMDQIISHQLHRATLQSQPPTRQPIKVEPLVTRLGLALEKVYCAKKIALQVDIASQVEFQGDQQDLMEVVGNLLENAFKYGCHNVLCHADNNADNNQYSLSVIIEDDGPGVPPARQKHILQRGARADTATPGQGIGLAVAVDIVSSYGGSIKVGQSDLGGAKFEVLLP